VATFVIVCATALLAAACAAQEAVPIVTTRDVVYGKVGERELRLDIDQPRTPGAKMPVVVYIHGGAFRGGTHHGDQNRRFAAQGYFCVSIEYRLSGEAKWPAQIHDCKAAIRWLRANAERYRLDSERIGVWGHSAGGHLAALLGTSGDQADLEGASGNPGHSSRVSCVVDCFGPTNFLAMIGEPGMDHAGPDSPESQLLGKPLRQVPELVHQADPCTWVTPASPPFLIQHGERDMVVPCSQSRLLAEALQKACVEVTLDVVAGADHGFRGADRETLAALNTEVDSFFRRHLRGTPTEPPH